MMRWIREHKLISSLLLVIIVTFSLLVTSIASAGSGNLVTRGINSVVSFFVKPVANVGGTVSDNVNGIFSYRSIMAENNKLKEENAKLKKQVVNLTLADNQLKELQELSKALNYTAETPEREIVSADVVAMSGTDWTNIFTINCGTEKGIKTGDTVIAGEGLVGRIIDAGKGWAKVVTLVDQNSSVSFKLKGNLEMIGIANEVEDGKMKGFMLDSSIKLENGEQLITSGMGMFPGGIDVGTITKSKYDKDSHLLTVLIKPAVDFKSLQKVSVIL
ncbi:MAG: rod shape-determining protein MreC [Peptostreptococcaceae bacterium]|nr:rod shape-determining protein MreC [Peptostreptococcaceae bacterium]MDY5738812.1 rod shape-determining protein MreC [Anaerovoracaceae bacterium]